MNTLQNNSNDTLTANHTYNYLLSNNANYEGNDLHSITLKCCFLSDYHFVNTLLADSDWDSCQAENCSFKNISFENSDLTSTYFKNCTFDSVNFKGTTTTDITFIDCKFTDCNFNHIGLSSSVFENCQFENLKLRQSSTTLNQFKNCMFFNSKIAGNFLYNLFLQSGFKDTQISQDILASNFGFTTKNLKELSLNKIDIKNLQQKLLDKKDVIGADIISINLDELLCDYSILACMQVIIGQLRNNILVRVEQLLFFKNIINNLLITHKISLYTVIALLHSLEEIKFIETNIAVKKSEPAIWQIQGLLLEYYHQTISQLHDKLQSLKAEGNPIQLKITYKEEPAVPICSLFKQMMSSMNISGNYPVRIKTEVGSFIEWIQCYDNILKCLQLLVSVLGLSINLVKTKKANDKPMSSESNKDENASKNTSSDIQKNIDINDAPSNSVIFQIPESVIKQLNTATTEQNVHQTLNVFVLNGININNNFQGYNSFNIKEIEIL